MVPLNKVFFIVQTDQEAQHNLLSYNLPKNSPGGDIYKIKFFYDCKENRLLKFYPRNYMNEEKFTLKRMIC
jgi:hypothetical protein